MSLRACLYRDCYGSTASKHRFPNPIKHLEMFKKWVVLCANKKLLHKPAYTIYSTYRVCRFHFMEKDFATNNRLLRTAYPRENLFYPRLVTGKSAITVAAKMKNDISTVLKEMTSKDGTVEEVQQSPCQPPSTTHILKEMRCLSNTGKDAEVEEVQWSSFQPPSITQKRKQSKSKNVFWK